MLGTELCKGHSTGPQQGVADRKQPPRARAAAVHPSHTAPRGSCRRDGDEEDARQHGTTARRSEPERRSPVSCRSVGPGGYVHKHALGPTPEPRPLLNQCHVQCRDSNDVGVSNQDNANRTPNFYKQPCSNVVSSSKIFDRDLEGS